MSIRARSMGWMRLRHLVLVMLGASLPVTLGSFATPAAEFVPLGFLPNSGSSSTAYGISADGSTVAGESGGEAFRWTSRGGMQDLGTLPGGMNGSQAYGISADGSTVVGASSTASSLEEAFRWTSSGGMVGLGFLPNGQFSEAYAASADGSIIVGYSNGGSGQGVFIWDATHGMRDLAQILTNAGVDLSGWDLLGTNLYPIAISADGKTIMGTGDRMINSSVSTYQSWIAVIPEPGTAWLLGVGLVPLVGASIRKRRIRSV